ncbi:hypothetical protein [Herbiconiux liangxiaofengii]|uniref:hypothetical protein n=1 Tax=Herbiconiux liangxiaofengii TaxID=3342795 RepID=UPI0035B8D02B
MAVGPGIPFAITDTWLSDDRQPSRHDADSISYIEGEHESLEKDQLRERIRNVLVHGRFEKRDPRGHGNWRFSGHPAVSQARDPQEAVEMLNGHDIEVVSISENGAPGELAWSNVYIVGKHLEEPNG